MCDIICKFEEKTGLKVADISKVPQFKLKRARCVKVQS